MKKKEKYEQQKETRLLNEHRILRFLDVGRARFGELLESTGLTDAGLSKVLKRLEEQGKIVKEGKGKKTRYKLEHGSTAKEIQYLGYKIEDLRKDGGKYYVDFADNHLSEATGYGPPFGILSHIFLDKEIGKKFNPILKKDVFELENILFEKIKSNIELERIPKFISKEKADHEENTIIIAFEIKYQNLLNEIKNYNEQNHKKLLQLRLKEINK